MTDTQLKRRLATVLAMDAAGYSRMMSEDEEETLRTLAGHRQVIDQIIESRDGRIFGNAGDSVLAEFESPVEAVRCAIEIQSALKTRNLKLPDDRRMLFRIGINLGDVTVKEDDLLGDGVNVAARLEATAEPGGVCVSSSVYEQTLGKLTLGFSDLGELELKNITRPVRAYTVFEGEPSARPLGSRKTQSKKLPMMVSVGIPVLVVLAAILWWQQQQPVPPPPPAAPNPEEVLWEEIRNSSNPAEFAAYLEKYPNSTHSQLAKLRMEKLQAEEEQQRQLQATLQQAQEDLKNARDEAANAKAKQQQARLEAELQRARIEAEQARAAMQAEKLKLEQLEQEKQKMEEQKQAQAAAAAAKAAAAAAQPVVATPAPAAMALTGPQRYDGNWKLIFECDEFRGLRSFTQSVSGTMNDGTLTVEQGRAGQRGYFQASGRLTKKNGLRIIGVRYSPFKGGNVEVDYSGTFTADQLSGNGTFGYRDCALTMLRSALP